MNCKPQAWVRTARARSGVRRGLANSLVEIGAAFSVVGPEIRTAGNAPRVVLYLNEVSELKNAPTCKLKPCRITKVLSVGVGVREVSDRKYSVGSM